jgi:hypothetical protein
MRNYGERAFNLDEPEGYFWKGMAALRRSRCLNYFNGCMIGFFEGTGFDGDYDEMIGRIGNKIAFVISYIINEYQRMDPSDIITTQRGCFENIEQVYKVAWFYPAICQRARLAVDAWSLVGRRLGVSKDIRRLIGQMVWDLKRDADYAPGFHFTDK